MEDNNNKKVVTEHKGLIAWLKSRPGLAFIGFIVIAAFFLWEEHKAHILGILPFVLLLLCPLLHLFMHGGHGKGHGAHHDSERGKND